MKKFKLIMSWGLYSTRVQRCISVAYLILLAFIIICAMRNSYEILHATAFIVKDYLNAVFFIIEVVIIYIFITWTEDSIKEKEKK